MKNILHSSSSRWLWCHILASYCICVHNLTKPSNEFIETIENDSDTFGWISPKGTVVKRVGEQLEIFCTINLTTAEVINYTSSQLGFFKDGNLLDSYNVTEINETTISLHLLNEDESDHLYKCVLNGNKTKSTFASPNMNIGGNGDSVSPSIGNYQEHEIPSVSKSVYEFQVLIGSIRVVAGEKPKDLMNFLCFTDHYKANFFSCSLKIQKNFVETNYTIQQISSDFTISEKPHACEITEFYCLLVRTPRRSNDCCFHFSVTGNNIFGENEQTFIFDKFNFLQPEPPKLLSPAVTPTRMMIHWFFDINYIAEHSVNLTSEICFRNYYELPINWNCNYSSEERAGQNGIYDSTYNVTNLKPNTMYEVKIRWKFSEAPQHDEHWSKYTMETYKTISLLPTSDISVFQSLQTPFEGLRHIYTYWTPKECLRVDKKCRDDYEINNFKFSATDNKILTSDAFIFPPPSLRPASYIDWKAEFVIDPLAHRFVRSHEDHTRNESISVDVSALEDEIKLCALFYVVQHANNTYEYIWQPPVVPQGTVNYTLFWYHRDLDSHYDMLPYENMNWIYLSTSQSIIPFNFGPCITNVSIHYENKWNFYANINTENSSSSLHQSVELVSSVSGFWNSARFLELKEKLMNNSTKMEIKAKPRMNIGQGFSENQFYVWMNKLHAVEDPVSCRGRKNVIRIREYY